MIKQVGIELFRLINLLLNPQKGKSEWKKKSCKKFFFEWIFLKFNAANLNNVFVMFTIAAYQTP